MLLLVIELTFLVALKTCFYSDERKKSLATLAHSMLFPKSTFLLMDRHHSRKLDIAWAFIIKLEA